MELTVFGWNRMSAIKWRLKTRGRLACLHGCKAGLVADMVSV